MLIFTNYARRRRGRFNVGRVLVVNTPPTRPHGTRRTRRTPAARRRHCRFSQLPLCRRRCRRRRFHRSSHSDRRCPPSRRRRHRLLWSVPRPSARRRRRRPPARGASRAAAAPRRPCAGSQGRDVSIHLNWHNVSQLSLIPNQLSRWHTSKILKCQPKDVLHMRPESVGPGRRRRRVGLL